MGKTGCFGRRRGGYRANTKIIRRSIVTRFIINRVPDTKYLILKFTMGASGRGFEPLRRQIVFARTKRPIGGGSRPPEGTPWVTVLVYATLWD
jgi:hypothetical protein